MHLVGFITKKSVTMHGHMNVKISSCCNIILPSMQTTSKCVSCLRIYQSKLCAYWWFLSCMSARFKYFDTTGLLF